MRYQDLWAIKYWQSSPQKTAERFYIGFCLFMSSLQDTFLGSIERERENFNWSSTCSYYALVHAGRMLSFLALGDFPKQHSALRKLYSSQDPHTVPFDWLKGFLAHERNDEAIRFSRNGLNAKEARELIVSHLTRIGLDDALRQVQRFGQILGAAAPLRNDSNYEALLIAHEYEHPIMSKGFAALAEAMSKGAEYSLGLVQSSFLHYLNRDIELEERRESYKTFFSEYLQTRIRDAIIRKLDQSPKLTRKLNTLVTEMTPKDPYKEYRDLERYVDLAVFGPKAELMQNFREGIVGLQNVLSVKKSV